VARQPSNKNQDEITDGVSPCAPSFSAFEFELATMGEILG